MATVDDAARIALALPETVESTQRGMRGWAVRKKTFAWERPLRKAERAGMGDDAPDGPMLSVRTMDLDAKDAAIAMYPGCFTIPHFKGYPYVLLDLEEVDVADLEEILTDGWVTFAPKRVVSAWRAASTSG